VLLRTLLASVSCWPSLENETTGPRTALPSPNETGPEELTAQIRRGTWVNGADGEGVLFQERIEFRNKLGEVAKTKKASVQGPWRPCGSTGHIGFVAFAAEENYPLPDSLLAWMGIGVHTLDCGLRDSIEKAEAAMFR
jgi:hypothetical protein